MVEEILPALFTSLITGLNFTRSMRWGDEEARFIRPVRWIVALAGEAVIPMEFAHVRSGRMSRGHRFLCKEEVEIKSPETYKETMRKAFVIADQDERRALITAGLQKTAKELGGRSGTMRISWKKSIIWWSIRRRSMAALMKNFLIFPCRRW